MEFAIQVDSLTLIHVYSHGYQLAFESHAMMMKYVVRIGGALIYGDRRKVNIVLVFLFHLWIAEHHLGKCSCFPLFVVGLIAKSDSGSLGLFAFKVYEEAKLIIGAIAVEVVDLIRNLLAVNNYCCRLHILQLSEVESGRNIIEC